MLDLIQEYGILIVCLILVLLCLIGWRNMKMVKEYETTPKNELIDDLKNHNEDFNDLVKKNKERKKLSGEAKNYKWTQTETEVEMFVYKTTYDMTTKNIKVLFKPNTIKVEIDKIIAVEGEFFESIQPDDCTWVIDSSSTGERCIWITLFKTSPGLWECILKADRKPPVHEINANDPTSMREALKVLKKND
jgi:hypothetical protein